MRAFPSVDAADRRLIPPRGRLAAHRLGAFLHLEGLESRYAPSCSFKSFTGVLSGSGDDSAAFRTGPVTNMYCGGTFVASSGLAVRYRDLAGELHRSWSEHCRLEGIVRFRHPCRHHLVMDRNTKR
jgi:hypothetical protein